MVYLFKIDDIVDSPLKVSILRAFSSREGLKATGREIARIVDYSVPSTHESLKSLYERNVLVREIIGKQHIYSLNEADRIVKKIIRPMFEAESNYKQEIRDLLLKEAKMAGIKSLIVSLILYGSVEKNLDQQGSDVDVAVVVATQKSVEQVRDVFNSVIAERFKSFFGVHLDFYVKSATEFRKLLKMSQPPISTLMQAYSVLYGKEPLEV